MLEVRSVMDPTSGNTMAGNDSRKYWFWLIPLLTVLLVPLAVLATLWLDGWHWRGIGWRQGLTLQRLSWYNGDCLGLVAEGVRIGGLRPVRVTLDSISVPACPDEKPPHPDWTWAPSFDLKIWSLGIHEYPALQVQAHHRGTRWWGQAALQNSHLRWRYDAQDGRWHLQGAVEGRHLDDALHCRVAVSGKGRWSPSSDMGRLALRGGPGLGLAGQATLSWKAGILTLHPFSLTRPDGAVVTLARPRTVPLADPGTLVLPLMVQGADGSRRPVRGRLSWGAGGLHWGLAPGTPPTAKP